MGTAAKRLESIAPWAWTGALVVLFFAFWPLEWSFPACNVQEDGPRYPAYGFPLPYLQYDGAFTGSANVQPLALAVDLLLLGAAIFRLVRWSLARLPGRRLRLALAVLGLAVGVPVCSLGLLFGSLDKRAVWSLPTDGSYLDYRPVGWHGGGALNCTPSAYWFGPIRESVRRAWNVNNPDRPL